MTYAFVPEHLQAFAKYLYGHDFSDENWITIFLQHEFFTLTPQFCHKPSKINHLLYILIKNIH